MKAIFVPSLGEGKKIFPACTFSEWKYGIHKGVFKGSPVFTTGVSKTPAAFAVPVVAAEFGVREAVLAGVCGAYRNSGLNVGDIVTVSKDYFADEGLCQDGEFRTLADMGFGFIENRYIEFDIYEGLPVADSNTVSFLDGDGLISGIFQKSTGAQVENMEGAAFGYACKMLGIKAYQLRAVSNFCGKRSEQEWNFKKAAAKLKSFFESQI